MKRCFLHILSLGLFFGGAVAADEAKQVELLFSKWEVQGTELGKDTYEHRTFAVEFYLNGLPPFKFCPQKCSGAALSFTDDRGGKSPMLNAEYVNTKVANGGVALKVNVVSGKWLPKAGSSYVDLKGSLPVSIASGIALTAPVDVELKEGVSIPVTLKGAGKDNKDEAVTLSVSKCDVAQGRNGRQERYVLLRISATAPIAIYSLLLNTVDDKPVRAIPVGTIIRSGLNSGAESRQWDFNYRVQDESVQTVRIGINHATGVKQISVPVNVRCSWDMTAAPENADRKENQ